MTLTTKLQAAEAGSRDGMAVCDAVVLLRKRCEELDAHGRRFPNSVDRSFAVTSEAIKVVLDENEELTSRIGVMNSRAERCPQCADTKRACANVIAEFEVERRAAILSASEARDG